MSVEKYIKIKHKNEKSRGIDSLNNYISNPEKVTFSDEKSSISSLSEYMERDEKIFYEEDNRLLVTEINCSDKEFVKYAHYLEKSYHAKKSERLNEGHLANDVFHFISSYKGKDYDPEIIHQAGVELCEALCEEEFIGKITTHLDTENIHNHIAICAYAIDKNHKFKDSYHLYKQVKELSKDISLRYGLDFEIKGIGERKNWTEILEDKVAKKDIVSFTKEVKNDIRECALSSNNIEDMKKKMEENGYKIIEKKRGKSTGFTYVKENITVPDYRLGKKYMREGLEYLIEKNVKIKEKKYLLKKINQSKVQHSSKINLAGIYIQKYDVTGKRIPALLQLLNLIKEIISRIGDSFVELSLPEEIVKDTAMASSKSKLELLNFAISTCLKHGINTQGDIDDRIFKAGLTKAVSSRESEKLYTLIDKMENILQQYEKQKTAEKLLISLGINPEKISRNVYSPEDIKKNIASLDPLEFRKKKQIMSILSGSEYRILKENLNNLSNTDAKDILLFLQGKTAVRPPVLISRQEYERKNNEEIFLKRANEYFEKLHKKQHDEAITKKQVYTLNKLLSSEDQTKVKVHELRKDEANRLLNILLETPISNNKGIKDNVALTKWEMETLQLIVKLYPDNFQAIDISQVHKKEANNIIQHYFGKVDTIFQDIVQRNMGIKSEGLIDSGLDGKLQHFTKEEKRIVYPYKSIKDLTLKYGLQTEEDVIRFKARVETLEKEARELQEIANINSELYRDLSRTNTALSLATNKAFIFGSLFAGDTQEFQNISKSLESLPLDYLIELKENLPELAKKLRESYESGVYNPYVTRRIQKLKEIAQGDLADKLKNCPQKKLPELMESPVFRKELDKFISNKKEEYERMQVETIQEMNYKDNKENDLKLYKAFFRR